jgi:hypothetical protein
MRFGQDKLAFHRRYQTRMLPQVGVAWGRSYRALHVRRSSVDFIHVDKGKRHAVQCMRVMRALSQYPLVTVRCVVHTMRKEISIGAHKKSIDARGVYIGIVKSGHSDGRLCRLDFRLRLRKK